MNRTLAVALVAMLSLVAVPQLHAQSQEVAFSDDFETDQGWVASASTTSLPGTQWQKSTNGNGDESAWYLGSLVSTPAAEQALGYNNLASVFLTSPTIDLAGKNLAAISYDLEGGTEAGYDQLFVDVRQGTGGWVQLAVFSNAIPAWETQTQAAANPSVDPLAQISDAAMQMRFRFESDLTCSTFDDRAEELCDGPYDGWWLDNVNVYVVDKEVEQAPPPSEGQTGNVAPMVHAFSATPTSVDLLTDSGSNIAFTMDAQDDRRLVVSSVYMTHEDSGDILRVPLRFASSQQGPDRQNETWTGTLAVDDVRLRTGTWALNALVFDQQGGVNNSLHLNVGDLTVTATNAQAPTVTMVGNATNTQIMGPGSSLRFTPMSNIMERVTYRAHFDSGSVSPEFKLLSPYIINSFSLPAGHMTLEVRAYDRAGQFGNTTVDVIVDTKAPTLTITAPPAAYKDVPFVVKVGSKDTTDHTLTASFRDVTRNIVVQAGTQTNDITATINQTGAYVFAFRAVDQAGNLAKITKTITVVDPIVDATLDKVEVLDKRALPGESVRIRVDYGQTDGVISVPLTVTMGVADQMFNGTKAVAINGSAHNVFTGTFTPGPHTANVSVAAPGSFNETDAGNQNMLVDFEVFLGKVSIGAKDYYVRADDRGLPLEMLGPNDKTYPLALDNDYNGTVYKFTVDGLEYFWDPLDPDNSFEEPKVESKPSPGVGLLGLLALLFVAARRR